MVDKEELHAVRAYLEQTDPWLGEHGRARTEHDIRRMWELLLEVERLRDGISGLLERLSTLDEGVANWWVQDQLEALLSGEDRGR